MKSNIEGPALVIGDLLTRTLQLPAKPISQQLVACVQPQTLKKIKAGHKLFHKLAFLELEVF